MKSQKELYCLCLELARRHSQEEINRVALPYNDELAAISFGLIQAIIGGKTKGIRILAETAFMLGYEAGKNSKAGDFKPDKWAVADD